MGGFISLGHLGATTAGLVHRVLCGAALEEHSEAAAACRMCREPAAQCQLPGMWDADATAIATQLPIHSQAQLKVFAFPFKTLSGLGLGCLQSCLLPHFPAGNENQLRSAKFSLFR